ncbi:Cytochrome P450 monooxygenase paxP [Talaromyces pinophilus]|nr:Cytochrome P450 monooxygenase paxP [Talaromyces pinophilus]
MATAWEVEFGTQSWFALTSVAVMIALVMALLFRGDEKSHAPRIGRRPDIFGGRARGRAEFLVHGKRFAEEGYAKYKHSMYKVQTADMERLILSTKYLNELRSVPGDVLSSVDAQCERHLAWWTTLDVVKNSSLHTDVVRVQLTQNLRLSGPRLILWLLFAGKILNNAYRYAPGIHSVPAHAMVHRITSKVVNRALVGVPLCQNEEWLQTSLGYTVDAFTISGELRPLSWFYRPVAYLKLDARKSVKRRLETATRLIRPLVEQRQQPDPKHVDVIQWMVAHAQTKRDRLPAELAHKILFLCLASIASSSMGVTHALYDLCAMPEYIPILREEVETVLTEHGGWTLAALNAMRKLDSFLKESQRMNHPGLFSFNRKVLKQITLSDGTRLERGTFVSVPTYCIARDAEYYPSPLTFDGFRFSRLRESSAEDSNKHQFTSTGPANLAFGYGLNACPGRMFASCLMKIILGWALLGYDFQFPHGQRDRPSNIHMDERIWPDRNQEIEFQLRK